MNLKIISGLIIFLMSLSICTASSIITSSGSSYMIKDSLDPKFSAILILEKNTYECFSDCYARINISTTDKTKTAEILNNLMSINQNKNIGDISYKISGDYIEIFFKKKIKPVVISKKGIEETISMNNNFDWQISIANSTLSKWAWFNSSWLNRIQVNVTIDQDVINYQIPIEINYTSLGLNLNCANINATRFTDANDSEVGYFIHYCTTLNNQAKFFLQKSNLTAGTTYTYYMYYNNSLVESTSVSNDSIMDFVERCDGANGSYVSPNWNRINGGMFYETGLKLFGQSSCDVFNTTTNPDIQNTSLPLSDLRNYTLDFWQREKTCSGSGIDMQSWLGSTNKLAYTYISACTQKLVNDGGDITLGTLSSEWHHFYWKINDTPTLSVYWNGTLKNSGMFSNSASGKTRILNEKGNHRYIDEMVVRRYANADAISTFGIQENMTYPMFNITIYNPQNQNYSYANIIFNYSVSGTNSSYNCTSYLNESIINSNDSVLNDTPTYFNYTLNDTSSYSFNISCTVSSTTNVSNTIFFNISLPHYFSIIQYSPYNLQVVHTPIPTFNYKINGTETSYNCSLYVNNTLENSSAVSNDTFSNMNLTTPLIPGSYEWFINCTSVLSSNQSSTNIFYYSSFVQNPISKVIIRANKIILRTTN